MGRDSNDEIICRLQVTFEGALGHKLISLVGRPFERVLRFNRPRGFYIDTLSDEGRERLGDEFAVLNVAIQVSEDDLGRIPAGGPVVVVANHPLGGIEGLILATVLRSVRQDAKVVVDPLLELMSDRNVSFALSDPLDDDETTSDRMRECVAWVKGGGLLAVYPARSLPDQDLKDRAEADPEWRESVARLVRETEAPVLPILFHGFNEALFHILDLIQYRMRPLVQPSELFNRGRKNIELRVGSLIPFRKLASFADDREMTDYARMRTYILEGRTASAPEAEPPGPTSGGGDVQEPVAEPLDPKRVSAGVAGLPPGNTLVETPEFIVFLAEFAQAPDLMHEIGRLREITFRAVGEGTGKSLDLDEFDEYYKHVVVWNREKQEVVGAYRLGLTDEILPARGADGLYTSTLFHFNPAILRRIDPAVELGRSFVRGEYQRNYAPLLLLWKGIATYVLRNPRYKFLFGPVSINEQYNSISRQLMMRFLRVNHYLGDLAKFVQPRTPAEATEIKGVGGEIAGSLLADVDELSGLISDIEADQKGMPILLRQYLRLGGKLLGCNIDPDFSNVLDALLLVDLTATDPKILIRYMGKDEAREFFAYHQKLGRAAEE